MDVERSALPGGPVVWRAALVVLVLVGLFLRAPALDAPPVDGHHVRQADTASMARIMAREGATLWTPRIGWAGPEAGPVESEFPLYQALVGTIWGAVGSEPPVVPRLLSLLAWFLGGLALARLSRRAIPDVPLALTLGLYVLSPMGILLSRSIQPDALAVALLVGAWALVDGATEGRRPAEQLIGGGLLLGLAIAVKAPVILWAPPIALSAWRQRQDLPTPAKAVAVGLALVPPVVWYLHAHALGVDGASFKLWGADSGKWTTPAALTDTALWTRVAVGVVRELLTPVAGALLLVGAVLARRPTLTPAVLGVIIGVATPLLLLPGVATHGYYLLPMLPFASLVLGAGVAWLWRTLSGAGTPAGALVGAVVAIALVVVSVRGSASFLGWGYSRDARIETIAGAARQVLPPGTATIVVDRHPQTLLYALDQRGWHRDKVSERAIWQLRSWGGEALLLTNTSPTWDDDYVVRELLSTHPIVARGEGWTLLRLDVTH